MEQLVALVRELSSGEIKADYSIAQGVWNHILINFIRERHFDLVLLGRPGGATGGKKYPLNAEAIASETNVPVITIPDRRQLRKFYSVLIPVTNFFPLRRLVYGAYVASISNATVKLLGVGQAKQNERTSFLLESSFDLIRNSPDFNVSFEMSKSSQVSEAVQATPIYDLVILTPQMKRELSLSRDGSAGDHTEAFSNFAVLTVNSL